MSEMVILLEARSAANIRCAQLALLIEQHRATHQSLPGTLENLAPELFEKIPPDPFAATPLKYKKLDKGYTIYSVGGDGIDHSGAKVDKDGNAYQPGTDIPFTVER